jgi:beta-lactamase regulating signal transducer with metallopeptidase domain
MAWLFFIWQAGALLLLGILGTGLLRLAWLQTRATALQQKEWTDLVTTLARDLELQRPVRLLRSDRPLTPMTWGVHRPVIMLPSTCDTWTETQRREVLVHELAHIKRQDCLTQGIAQLACVVYWFHPLVWLAARRMRTERERACDDRVLLTGVKPSAYAGHLLQIACSLGSARSTSVLSVAMARQSQISGRLMALLDPQRRRRHPGRITVFTVALLVLLIALPIAMLDSHNDKAEAASFTAELALTADPEPRQSRDEEQEKKRAAAEEHERQARQARETDKAQKDQAEKERQARLTAEEEKARLAAEAEQAREARAQLAEQARLTAEAELAQEASAQREQQARLTAAAEKAQQARAEMEHRLAAEERAAEARAWETYAEASRQGSVSWAPGSASSSTVTTRSGSSNWVYNDDDYTLKVKMEGEIEFDVEAGVVTWLEDGAYFDLREEQDGDKRRMVVKPGEDGEPEYTYYGGRRKQPYDDEAKEWFGQALAKAFKHLGIGVDVMVKQIYERDGMDGLLAEIEDIDSDFTRGQYYSEAMALKQLSTEEQQQLLQHAATNLDSDFAKGQMLSRSLDAYMAHPALRQSYFEAVQDMDSDFQKGQTLQAALKSGKLTSEDVVLLLNAAEDMDSDFETARLLTSIDAEQLEDSQLRDAYFKAVAGLDSDFERGRVLKAALASDTVPLPVSVAVLQALAAMDSDFEAVNVLEQVADHWHEDDAEREAYFAAVNNLDSDFETRRALETLAGRKDLLLITVVELLRSIGQMDSDFEKSHLLISLIPHCVLEEELQNAFELAADTIDSEFEYGRVMKAYRKAKNTI